MSAISNLKTALGAGLRTTKYLVQIFPNNEALTDFNASKEAFTEVKGIIDRASKLDSLCKAVSFPQKSVGQTEIWVGGKKGMLIGDVEFDHTWDLTFYETEKHEIRKAFLAWQDSIDETEEYNRNDTSNGAIAKIYQLDGQGKSTVEYTFYNIWPLVIGSIDMANDSVNTIGEFTVSLSFDYWKMEN